MKRKFLKERCENLIEWNGKRVLKIIREEIRVVWKNCDVLLYLNNLKWFKIDDFNK